MKTVVFTGHARMGLLAAVKDDNHLEKENVALNHNIGVPQFIDVDIHCIPWSAVL